MYVDLDPTYRPSDKSLTGYTRVYEVEAVKNSLRNLFLIRQGTVPGKPWLGNSLYSILFDAIDQFTVKFITEHIRNQLDKYEPRVTLVSINVDTNEAYNRIDVNMNYFITIQDEKYFDTLSIKDLNTITSKRLG